MVRLLRRFATRVIPARYRPYWLVTSRILAASDGRVMQGPFRGLKLAFTRTVLDWPKLLGTYERELHPAIERIIASPPPAVINVGAAEGYYAVGLAARCPGLPVMAFEERDHLRNHVARAAAANGVASRVEVLGRCDSPDLVAALHRYPGSLLVVDIEGGEVELLDLERIPAVRHCPMLIETHDALVPGCTDLLTARFRRTHRLEVIRGEHRRVADLPMRWPLATRWLRRLMSEGRTGLQDWLYLAPAEVPHLGG